MELATEMQRFWASARMVVMNRQQGAGWADTGRMSIVDFLHVLALSERTETAQSEASRKATTSPVSRRQRAKAV